MSEQSKSWLYRLRVGKPPYRYPWYRPGLTARIRWWLAELILGCEIVDTTTRKKRGS